MSAAGRAILVTGCAGFIGSRVCERLLAAGHAVVGVDDLNDAYDVSLKRWRLAQLEQHPGFRFHHADITQRGELEPIFGLAAGGVPLTAVINLAARAGVRYSVENPWIYFETNVTGTLNLLELCRHYGIGKFVQASSSSVYGAGEELPYREDMRTDWPLSPYAASKKAAESLCHSYHHLYGLDVTIFRYFTVYGPAGRPDMLSFRLVQWISEGRPVCVYGDGSQSRDFTYVDDIARGTIAGLQPLGYEIINLGSDRPVTVMELLTMVEQELGLRAAIRYEPSHPADVAATWADIGAARRLLDWQPTTSIREGVANTVAWYVRERDWACKIPAG